MYLQERSSDPDGTHANLAGPTAVDKTLGSSAPARMCVLSATGVSKRGTYGLTPPQECLIFKKKTSRT